MDTPVTLEQVMACPNLPTLPAVAVEVLSLTRDPDVQLSEIAKVVQNDQALSARVLKTVNSSFYGLARPCPTISRALTYMGLSTVKSLVLGFSLVDSTRRATDCLDLVQYWRRSTYSAAAARRIAGLAHSCDPEEAFIAALMQDLGMPAIFTTLGRGYQELIAQTDGDHDRLPDVERRSLGFTHGDAGTRLGERWRLPESIVDAIHRHHEPESPTGHLQVVRAVALGYDAARAVSDVGREPLLARFLNRARDWFGIPDDQAKSLLALIVSDAKELARLLQLDTGECPDVGMILAQAQEASFEHQLQVQLEAERLRRAATELALQAMTDGLTGVANRRRFDEELGRRFHEACQSGADLGMLMIDADRFKAINDALGHGAGDAVLKEIAARLTREVGGAGVVCRYGGEEFTVILPGMPRAQAGRLADRLRTAVESSPVVWSEGGLAAAPVSVTVSVGVAARDSATAGRFVTPQMLVQAADQAVYAAKRAGRNCVRIFSAKDPAKAA